MLSQTQAKGNLRLLNGLTFLSGFRTFEAVIIVYFAAITGSYTLAMGVLAAMNLSAALLEVPTGLVSDRIGRKKTLIVYYFSGLIGTVLFYFAESSLLLFIGAIVLGLSMALRSGTVSAFVYENLEVLAHTERFKEYEGHRQSLGRYALVAAGVVGSVIIYLFDIRAAILLTALMLAAAVLVGFRLVDSDSHKGRTTNIYADLKVAWKKFKGDAGLRNVSIGRILARGGGNAEYRFRALFFALFMPDWLVNLMGMVNQFISAIFMKQAHKIVQRFGFVTSLVRTEIFDRFATTVLILAQSISAATAMSGITGAIFGLREIASEDLLQKRYRREQRATMGSIVSLGGTLIYSIFAIIIGGLADFVGPMKALLILQPVLIISAWFFYRGITQLHSGDSRD